jgi:hypothetical protein
MEIVAKVVPTSAGGVNLRIWRERGQKQVDAPKTLEPLNETTPDCGESRTASVAPSLWSLVGSAFAQGMQTQDLYNSLQSDDVFTRRQARIDLSQKGSDAFQTISDLLGADAYRLKLGGLVALAGMPDDQRKTAPAEIWDKVRPLLGSSDKTMRDTAVQALREPAYCYQEEDLSKKAEEKYLALCQWSHRVVTRCAARTCGAALRRRPAYPLTSGRRNGTINPAESRVPGFNTAISRSALRSHHCPRVSRRGPLGCVDHRRSPGSAPASGRR